MSTNNIPKEAKFNISTAYLNSQVDFMLSVLREYGDLTKVPKEDKEFVLGVFNKDFKNNSLSKGLLLNKIVYNYIAEHINSPQGTYYSAKDKARGKRENENLKASVSSLQKLAEFKLSDMTQTQEASAYMWDANAIRHTLNNEHDFRRIMEWVLDSFPYDGIEAKKDFIFTAPRSNYQDMMPILFYMAEESQKLITTFSLGENEQKTIMQGVLDANILPISEEVEHFISHALNFSYLKSNMGLKYKMISDTLTQADIKNTTYDDIDISKTLNILTNFYKKVAKENLLSNIDIKSVDFIVGFTLQLSLLQLSKWSTKTEVEEIKKLPLLLAKKEKEEVAMKKLLSLFVENPEAYLDKIKKQSYTLDFCGYVVENQKLYQSPKNLRNTFLLKSATDFAEGLISNHDFSLDGLIYKHESGKILLEKVFLNLSMKYGKISELAPKTETQARSAFKI